MGLGSGQQRITKLNSIPVTQSVQAIALPVVFGQDRTHMNLLWYGDFTAAQAKTGGKGLGGKGNGYDYSAAVAAGLCQGPIGGIVNVWSTNGQFVQVSATETHTVGGGGDTYTVANAALFAVDQGAGAFTAYSQTVNDYGSPGSVTLSGNYLVPLAVVVSGPGAGQYSVNPGTGVYTFGAPLAGQTIYITYSYYYYRYDTQENDIVPSTGPYQITVQQAASFSKDFGVVYFPGGAAFTKVSSPTVAGQYSESGGTYHFSAADASQLVEISYEWINQVTDPNAPNRLNFTLFEGTLGQAAWGFLTSKFPSAALGYSQTAYVGFTDMFLGEAAEIPDYTFEVSGRDQWGAGIVDANAMDCIIDILTASDIGIGFPVSYLGSTTLARQFWAANNFFISQTCDNQEDAHSIIAEWLEAGQVAGFWSEGVLKFVPYGDTSAAANGNIYIAPTQPVVDLDDSDYLDKDDPVQISRKQWVDAYNRVAVDWNVRINAYNDDILYEEDAAAIQQYGLRSESPVEWAFIKMQLAAQFAASMRVKRLVYIRNTYKFTIGWIYSFLEPMDLVTITDTILGFNLLPVRIISIDDDPDKGLQIVAEDFPWGTATASLYSKQSVVPYYPQQGQADPGNTSAIIFEAPNPLGFFRGNILYIFTNGSNPNWGGCNIWVSFDASTYSLYQTVNFPGRIGVLTANLASYSGSNPDTTDTLSVQMATDAQLASVSSAEAAARVSICAVVNPDGTNLELLSYETATLTGNNTYALTQLYRAQYGTTGTSHSSTSPQSLFCRLDEASATYQYSPALYGSTIYFKFTSFNLMNNMEQLLSAVTQYSFALAGAGKGVVELDTGYVLSTTGTIPPIFSGTLSYTSTTTTLTWTWTSLVIFRPDGSTTSVPNGSVVISALTANTTYYFYPYYNDATQAIGFSIGGVGTSSLGAIAQTSKNNAALQLQQLSQNVPLSNGAMTGATPSSGSGGGSGGGTGICIKDTMLVGTRRGIMPISRCSVGDWLDGPDGWTQIERLQFLPCEVFVTVLLENGDTVIATPTHPFQALDENGLDVDVRAKDLTLSHLLKLRDGGASPVRAMEVLRDGEGKKAWVTCAPSRLFYAGEEAPNIVTHNAVPIS